MYAQLSKKRCQKYFCEYCDNACGTLKLLNEHKRFCQDYSYITTCYPKKEEDGSPPILEFKNYKNSQQHPIMIMGDTEALLIKVSVDEKEQKTFVQNIHKASCVGMYVNRFDGKNSYFEFYRKDCMEKFVQKIEDVVEDFVNDFNGTVEILLNEIGILNEYDRMEYLNSFPTLIQQI